MVVIRSWEGGLIKRWDKRVRDGRMHVSVKYKDRTGG